MRDLRCIQSLSELTQGQWQKVMASNPSHFNKGEDYPVENVSWDDAKGFIEKLAFQNDRRYEFRQPTEVEWEYACRSGGKSEEYAGGAVVDRFAWYDSNSGASAHVVGMKAPNGIGLYDMSGDVFEWCEDTLSENALGRMCRGGCLRMDLSGIRCAFSHPRLHYHGNDCLGFRLVRTK